MSNASNAVTQLGVIPETVFGTTPTTPAFIAQRFASGTFTITKAELTDDSKTGTRQYQYTNTGNSAVTGTLTGPLSHDNYDTLFTSAMYNAWATNVLKFGTTLSSLSIEESQPDVPMYRLFKGMIANGFTINAPTDGLVQITFPFLGLTETVATTSADSDGYTAQAVRQPFTHCGGTILEGGSAIAYVQSVNLQVNNNLSPAYVWGNCSTADLIPGRVDVTGTLTAFVPSIVLLNKFLNGTASALSFTMTDGTHTLQFNLPNIRYTGADLPIDAGSGPRILSLPFRGLYDPTAASTLVITRSA